MALMAREIADKSAARQWVWDRLRAEGVVRYLDAAFARVWQGKKGPNS